MERAAGSSPVALPAPSATSEARDRARLVVLLTVVLASLWPLVWAHSNGGLTSLLGVGAAGPSRALVTAEIPDVVLFAGLGHDGQQFYAVARHPFDPTAARDALDSPAYRYRRILFPAAAGAFAPGGGRPLIAAMLGVSLLGVALAAWSLTRLPDAPPWLPLVVGITPGVGIALTLSLADAVATGLAVAAVVASTRRRWGWMTLTLVAGALTRETLLLVAIGLACTAGLSLRRRLLTVGAPAAVAGLWALWSTSALGTAAGEGAGQVALPMLGWLQSEDSLLGVLVGLLTTAVLSLGSWRLSRSSPDDRGIAVVLGLHALLLLCLADDVTASWVNTTRVAAPVFPIAVWALVRREAPVVAPVAAAPERMEVR